MPWNVAFEPNCQLGCGQSFRTEPINASNFLSIQHKVSRKRFNHFIMSYALILQYFFSRASWISPHPLKICLISCEHNVSDCIELFFTFRFLIVIIFKSSHINRPFPFIFRPLTVLAWFLKSTSYEHGLTKVLQAAVVSCFVAVMHGKHYFFRAE